MATKSTKNPPRQFSEADRWAINQCREEIKRRQALLRTYGLPVDVESDNPMDDVSYEQRNCRMKAADLAATLWAGVSEDWTTQQVCITADQIYRFIWTGDTQEVRDAAL